MKLLLDTHVLLWWLTFDDKLPARIVDRLALPESELVVSAVCGWEIATKANIGKLPLPAGLLERLESDLSGEGIVPLDITFRHSRVAGSLPLHHRDPFDRMLIAQAMVENMPILSNDRHFDAYGVNRLW